MSFMTIRRQRLPTLVAAVIAMVVLTGCADSSGSTSALAEFAVDFAREVLAAWLL